jgi:hypothetical protein
MGGPSRNPSFRSEFPAACQVSPETQAANSPPLIGFSIFLGVVIRLSPEQGMGFNTETSSSPRSYRPHFIHHCDPVDLDRPYELLFVHSEQICRWCFRCSTCTAGPLLRPLGLISLSRAHWCFPMFCPHGRLVFQTFCSSKHFVSH